MIVFQIPDRIIVDTKVLEKNISSKCSNCGNEMKFKYWKTKGKGPSPNMVLECTSCKRYNFFRFIFKLKDERS